MKKTAIWRGIGAGAVAGAAIGAIWSTRSGSMHTGIGRAMKHAGAAMDNALCDIKHAMR